MTRSTRKLMANQISPSISPSNTDTALALLKYMRANITTEPATITGMIDSNIMRLDSLMGNIINETANGIAHTRNPKMIAFLIECIIYFLSIGFMMMLGVGSVIIKGFQAVAI